MSLNPRVVKESFARIEPLGDKAVAYFYGRLFAESPRLRALFPPAMDAQRDRLFHALTKIVWSLDSPAGLASYLERLGRDHRKFGVQREHYDAVGSALIATLRKFSGTAWTAETEEAWTAAYATAAELMIGAADADAADSPPWWVAEVLDHQVRAPGIAVLTLRPGRPLPFAAGQHVSVQALRWPRVWRTYSVANAPRTDGVLRLHVRALPAGWVSGTLVRRTGAGDTVLLGPAMGTMTLDHAGDRDLLLVAGGTGLAPLKALAEEVVMTGGGRTVQLVFGARTERELYDLEELRLLESAYPWLRVFPVVSDDRRCALPHGTAADLLARLPGLDDPEVYVAGPAAMITRTVEALQGRGVPATRIHHDPLYAPPGGTKPPDPA